MWTTVTKKGEKGRGTRRCGKEYGRRREEDKGTKGVKEWKKDGDPI
jgi:hypothetical protein